VRIVHLCDDFKTAEFLTTDGADDADNDRQFPRIRAICVISG
jgi:hypothetical protein